jgi:small-conductance mechanosensitive channel
MDDSAFIVSGKFMTKPNKQWGVRKAVYERVQQKFKEFGIKFAPKRVIVDVPTAADMEDEAEPDGHQADKGSAATAPAVTVQAAAAAAVATEKQ